MKTCKVTLDEDIYTFYSKIAREAGFPVEKVLADALFAFAGDVAVKAFGEETKLVKFDEFANQ